MRTTLPARAVADDDADTRGAQAPWDGARPSRSARRRSAPHLVLGVLLVVGCAVAFLVVVTNSGGRQSVLATARPVGVGQVLAAQDLRQVDIPVDVEVRAVAATRATDLVGRPVTSSLPAGALLTPEAVGGANVPPPGQAIVALALDPGRVPPEASSGDRVSVVVVPDRNDPGVGAVVPRSWSAVVTSVDRSDARQQTVVSVQLAETPAREVAATPAGRLALVLVSASG
jgi:Flp pilus assembly protein CpaB